jgi:hypothetical protein
MDAQNNQEQKKLTPEQVNNLMAQKQLDYFKARENTDAIIRDYINFADAVVADYARVVKRVEELEKENAELKGEAKKE